MKNTATSFRINIALLLSTVLMILTGLVIQLRYHIGGEAGVVNPSTVWGINHYGWSLLHKISSSIFFIFMIKHIMLHWKMYKVIAQKKLYSRNKQLLTLSLVFILATITGFIPWLIHLIEGETQVRHVFIEIHDKIALIFLGYSVLHISNRLKWFIRLKN